MMTPSLNPHAAAPDLTQAFVAALTLLIVAINGFNRLNVGFRAVHPVARREAA
jgi:hypothetical protein